MLDVLTVIGFVGIWIAAIVVWYWVWVGLSEVWRFLLAAAKRQPPVAEHAPTDEFQFSTELTTPFNFPPMPLRGMKRPGVLSWSGAVIQVARSGTPEDFRNHVLVLCTETDWDSIRPALEYMMLALARQSHDGTEAALEGLVQGALEKMKKGSRT